MPKRIGIDVYTALHSPRGMGIYVINFVKHLAELDDENTYLLYADIEDSNNVFPQKENFIFKKLNAHGLFHYEQFVLPMEAKKDKLDILHSPANTSPIFLDKKIKRVLTLHDIIFLKNEIPLPSNKKQLLGRLYYILTAILNSHKANKIFTVSEYSKNDIYNCLKIDKSKIIVHYHGIEHFSLENATNLENLQKKYKIPDKYCFTLGGEAPSKNTKILLELFSEQPDINLVVAGIKNLENSLLYKSFKKFKNITFVPYITQEDIVGLYKNAKMLIFPSIYEGFGFPLIEAMTCSCPILSSNTTCLPEVAKDAAIYFNPFKKEDIFNKIKTVITDLNCRTDLTSKGQKQLKKYKWNKLAEIILGVYSIE